MHDPLAAALAVGAVKADVAPVVETLLGFEQRTTAALASAGAVA
jgi:hypothetical protein